MPMPMRGAGPSSNGVEPSGLAAALCGRSGRAKQRGISDQRDRVKRDTDGIEDRGQNDAMRGASRSRQAMPSATNAAERTN